MLSKLCNPENYIRVAQLIQNTLNEDVTYSTQPIELRNQRVYAIKVGILPCPTLLPLIMVGWGQRFSRRGATDLQGSQQGCFRFGSRSQWYVHTTTLHLQSLTLSRGTRYFG